jgi:hypothetical protein
MMKSMAKRINRPARDGGQEPASPAALRGAARAGTGSAGPGSAPVGQEPERSIK